MVQWVVLGRFVFTFCAVILRLDNLWRNSKRLQWLKSLMQISYVIHGSFYHISSGNFYSLVESVTALLQIVPLWTCTIFPRRNQTAQLSTSLMSNPFFAGSTAESAKKSAQKREQGRSKHIALIIATVHISALVYSGFLVFILNLTWNSVRNPM